jgi:Fe-S cluster biogenesis protein NfuA/nitrite reductase/ring-hydroxylating ferredoxin subunit
VRAALEEVRPYLESHGGDVELVAIEDGVAHLRMHGSCKGCPSSAMTLKLAIETAVLKAAPDLDRIQAEEEEAGSGLLQIEKPDDGLLQIEMRLPAAAPVEPAWTAAGGIAVTGDGPLVKDVGGKPVMFVRVDGTQYAYRPECPGCHASLAHATLRAGHLACTRCDQRYDVRGAGRCLTSANLHLDPIPLLVGEDGQVTVAIGAAA